MTPRILIIGANGQIGTELTHALVQRHGREAVVTSDLAPEGRVIGVHHEALDATEASALTAIVARTSSSGCSGPVRSLRSAPRRRANIPRRKP